MCLTRSSRTAATPKAAKRLLTRLLKKQNVAPKRMITDNAFIWCALDPWHLVAFANALADASGRVIRRPSAACRPGRASAIPVIDSRERSVPRILASPPWPGARRRLAEAA